MRYRLCSNGYGASDINNVWRVKLGNWLQANFPDATVNNINKACGESGTYLGSYRLARDVISQNPDLLVLEYSINDFYDGASYERAAYQYETIVRQVKEAIPDCNIVTVLHKRRRMRMLQHIIIFLRFMSGVILPTRYQLIGQEKTIGLTSLQSIMFT